MDHRTSELVEARLQLHYAAQIVSAFSATLGEPSSDFSHTALRWDREHTALMCDESASKFGVHVSLKLKEFQLSVLAETDSTLVLAERTVDEALGWLSDAVGWQLKMPTHDLPAHALAEGAKFHRAFAHNRMVQWFTECEPAISAVAADHDRPVRVWPHHFDLATLLELDKAPDGQVKSVGVGFSPGDAGHPRPYIYITPWPYPQTALPDVAEPLRWNREGWTGLLLPGDAHELDADGLVELLRDGIAICRTLLD